MFPCVTPGVNSQDLDSSLSPSVAAGEIALKVIRSAERVGPHSTVEKIIGFQHPFHLEWVLAFTDFFTHYASSRNVTHGFAGRRRPGKNYRRIPGQDGGLEEKFGRKSLVPFQGIFRIYQRYIVQST